MPQSLLALFALASAALITLGQKEASTHTLESIVRDEFELSVAGTLLNAMEYADARAFDEATTPASLRARLGLAAVVPDSVLHALTVEDMEVPVSAFAQPGYVARTAAGALLLCNVKDPQLSPLCNDLSDLGANTWQDVTFSTPNGDPLPVQVRMQVSYVRAGNPDAIVNERTYHKRVDVWARSPILTRRSPDHVVHLSRVISYDPAVALEYLRRFTCTPGEANTSLVGQLQAALVRAREAAERALAQVRTATTALATAEATAATRAAAVTTTASAASTAAATATQKATAATAATAAAAAANAQAAQSAEDYAAAQATVDYWQNLWNQYPSYRTDIMRYYLGPAKTARDNARAQRDRDRQAATTAQQAATTAQQAAAAAVTASTAAQQAAAAAVTASTAAQQAIVTARQALAAAQAAVPDTAAAITAAEAALAAATVTCS